MKIINSLGYRYLEMDVSGMRLKIGKDNHGSWFTQWCKGKRVVVGSHGGFVWVLQRVFSRSRYRYAKAHKL